eukprot:tig00000378_g24506.t1
MSPSKRQNLNTFVLKKSSINQLGAMRVIRTPNPATLHRPNAFKSYHDSLHGPVPELPRIIPKREPLFYSTQQFKQLDPRLHQTRSSKYLNDLHRERYLGW